MKVLTIGSVDFYNPDRAIICNIDTIQHQFHIPEYRRVVYVTGKDGSTVITTLIGDGIHTILYLFQYSSPWRRFKMYALQIYLDICNFVSRMKAQRRGN